MPRVAVKAAALNLSRGLSLLRLLPVVAVEARVGTRRLRMRLSKPYSEPGLERLHLAIEGEDVGEASADPDSRRSL